MEMEENARWPDLPVGYRFTPTPRELIHYYLNTWVTCPGERPFGEPEGIVCAADVYSADPGTLTSRLRHFGHDDGNWYFLCVTRWKAGNVGTRMNRTVQGGGKWHGSGKRIKVRRWPYGYRQTFEYRDAGGDKCTWLMEEFRSALPEATDGEGIKVLCRVHRTPRAAAEDDGEEKRQETNDDVQFPSKRPCQDHGFDAADYWMAPAPPDVGCSYASTSQTTLMNGAASTTWPQQQPMMEQGVGYHCAGVNGGEGIKVEHGFAAADYWTAPAPSDVGCSYASTSQAALVNGAASTTWQQQQQPMMEQGVGYHCAGVNGHEDVKGEPEPSEMLPPDMAWQQFEDISYGFDYAAENAPLNQNEWMRNTFSCPQPIDGVQEDDEPRGDTAAN